VDKVTIAPVTPADVAELFAHIRPVDLQEIAATSSLPPLAALVNSVRLSTYAWSARINDQLLCVFGVAPVSVIAGVGAPWLIGTEAMDVRRHRLIFARRCAAQLRRMQATFPTLRNYADARNQVTLRWLSWLGFEIQPAIVFGAQGRLFHPFELRR